MSVEAVTKGQSQASMYDIVLISLFKFQLLRVLGKPNLSVGLQCVALKNTFKGSVARGSCMQATARLSNHQEWGSHVLWMSLQEPTS